MEKGSTAKVAEIRSEALKAGGNKQPKPASEANKAKPAAQPAKNQSALKKVASVVALPIDKNKQENPSGYKDLFSLRGLRPQQLRRRILALSFAYLAQPTFCL